MNQGQSARAVCGYRTRALSIQHSLGCINWHSCNKCTCSVWFDHCMHGAGTVVVLQKPYRSKDTDSRYTPNYQSLLDRSPCAYVHCVVHTLQYSYHNKHPMGCMAYVTVVQYSLLTVKLSLTSGCALSQQITKLPRSHAYDYLY